MTLIGDWCHPSNSSSPRTPPLGQAECSQTPEPTFGASRVSPKPRTPPLGQAECPQSPGQGLVLSSRPFTRRKNKQTDGESSAEFRRDGEDEATHPRRPPGPPAPQGATGTGTAPSLRWGHRGQCSLHTQRESGTWARQVSASGQPCASPSPGDASLNFGFHSVLANLLHFAQCR